MKLLNYIFGVALTSTLLLACAEGQVACPKCSTTEALVCGKDTKTNKLRTFTNSCYLTSENCWRGTSYVKVYSGKCICPACPVDDNFPVCGVSVLGEKKRFENFCELVNYSCSNPTEYIPLTCPVYVRKPDGICAKWGQDLKTFDDTCQMETYNCLFGTHYVLIDNRGPCLPTGITE